ncbi:hypothetical protein [Trinickia sp. Y13]|uniref:hypothetical protein n=1 Tax=Trinickia sp. Y13 TaxID=2917807 RepID=UPI002406C422|nr:hypothetical protein [Trinickia sp. Y13]MDG0022862.1 hypothetical protein [Trinickia sp. Y13]
MNNATQYMSIQVEYSLLDPSTPYSPDSDTTVEWGMDQNDPMPFAWSLWSPLNPEGAMYMNQLASWDSKSPLNISYFSIQDADDSVALLNTVKIIIPTGITFPGLVFQFYLLADKTVQNKTPVDFTAAAIPTQLQITIRDGSDSTNKAVLTFDEPQSSALIFINND